MIWINYSLEIGGYAVKIFEKNENFWGIKRKNLKIIKKNGNRI